MGVSCTFWPEVGAWLAAALDVEGSMLLHARRAAPGFAWAIYARWLGEKGKVLGCSGRRQGRLCPHHTGCQTPCSAWPLPPCDRWTTTRSGSGNRCRMPWRR